MTQSTERPPSKFRRFVGWIFCVFFSLLALVTIISSPLIGAGFVALAILSTPGVRDKLYALSPHSMAGDINIAMVAILVGTVAVDLSVLSQGRARDRLIDQFQSDRDAVMADLQRAYDQKAYQKVLDQAEPYLTLNDADLTQLHDQATQRLAELAQAKAEAERKADTERLVTLLKTIPASEIHRNRTLYARLVTMNPDNDRFRAKLDHYTAKVREQQAREKAEQERRRKAHQARIARFGKKPEQLSWDGSYLPVRNYLDYAARDPDSVEFINCTDVKYHDAGWLIGCDFRARNGFGGMTVQSNWFTIRHGAVIDVHEAGAFRP